jgi:hypothetical protein
MVSLKLGRQAGLSALEELPCRNWRFWSEKKKSIYFAKAPFGGDCLWSVIRVLKQNLNTVDCVGCILHVGRSRAF